MEEQIILAVSDFPLLYDPSRNDYRDVHKKAAAWELVGARVSLSGEEAKKRWKNLRDTFMRTRKALKNKKSGSAAGDMRIWRYFHIMSFLEPFIKERDTSGNLTVGDEEEEEEEEIVTLTLVPVTEGEDGGAPELLQTSASDITTTTTTTTASDSSIIEPSARQTPLTSAMKSNPGKRKRPDHSSFEEAILSRVAEIQAQIQNNVEDEDELFLQSLLPVLRRLVGARKSEAKMAIMKLLHNVEFGEE